MDKIVLTGSNTEMADQLLGILKDKTLSVEELKEIMPNTKEFLQALLTTLNKTIDEEAKSDKLYTETIQMMWKELTEIIKDGNVSDSEKTLILQMTKDLQDKLHEQKMNRDKENGKVKRALIAAGTVILGILIILSGGSGNDDNKPEISM